MPPPFLKSGGAAAPPAPPSPTPLECARFGIATVLEQLDCATPTRTLLQSNIFLS